MCEGKDGAVLELHQQLHEKDMKLTDIRLEALSSAHQLEQLRDAMNRMKVWVKDNWCQSNLVANKLFSMVTPVTAFL